MKAKEYTGSCYIGVVGSELEHGACRDTIEKIVTRKKDERAEPIRATKGYEARQMHLNNWYTNTKHPFLLLLDSDMLFPPDTLERLRGHKQPFVSGFYMRRMIRPVLPVWYEQGQPGVMPMKPMTAVLEHNKTYPIGASGWGCMLIHRDVVTATKKLLKGENEIIEDDMDLYPYDYKKIMQARRIVLETAKGKPMTEANIKFVLETFVNEIKPLRGIQNEVVGSDIRFPFFAHLAGFPLLGDTGVHCHHMTDYPVSLDDWLNQPAFVVRDLSLHINEEDRQEHARIRKATA